jgi:RNA polymerase sigma-70 factor (ECF subfamily)
MLKEVAEEEDGEEYFSQMYNYSQGFEETIICKEAEYNIQELLEELPYEKKEVLVLRMFYGFRYVDIAQYVGVPLGTIKSRIFNALHDLRKKINKKEVFNKHEQSPYN